MRRIADATLATMIALTAGACLLAMPGCVTVDREAAALLSESFQRGNVEAHDPALRFYWGFCAELQLSGVDAKGETATALKPGGGIVDVEPVD